MDDKIEEVREKKRDVERGGEERIEKQHEKGKLTACERTEYFLDDGTFK